MATNVHQETVSSGQKWQVGETLRLQRPNLRFWAQTAACLVLLLLLAEMVFRIHFLMDRFAPWSLGSRHRQLEIQFARLERLERLEGHVDCIVLGNSMTWLGVNPVVINQVVSERTGEPIRCFNFGVSAMPASSAGLVAEVLVDRYHPNLLIYGTTPRDYAIPDTIEDAYVVSETPWLHYQSGEWNLTGWLYDISYVVRYKTLLRDITLLKTEDVIQDNYGPEDYKAYGLDPKLDVVVDIRKPPNRDDHNSKMAFLWLYYYDILDENLAGLRQVIAQSEKGVQVILLEMPSGDYEYQFYINGKQDYDRFLDAVQEIASESEVPFWRSQDALRIAPEHWWDFLHLNLQGANEFSEWLGIQISNNMRMGKIHREGAP